MGYTLLERADGCRLYEIFLFYFDGLISLPFLVSLLWTRRYVHGAKEFDLERGVLESRTIGINRGLPVLP